MRISTSPDNGGTLLLSAFFIRTHHVIQHGKVFGVERGKVVGVMRSRLWRRDAGVED